MRVCVRETERKRVTKREGEREREREREREITGMGVESNSKIRNESGDVTTN